MEPIGSTRVLHLAGDGLPSQNHVAASPCAEVLFRFRPIGPGEKGAVQFEGRCWAMIDTGADISAIDAELVPAHAVRDIALPEISINGTRLAQVYRVTLLFAGTIKTFDTQVAAAAMSRDRPYRMIIGRQMLSHTRFIYDRTAGIRSLDIF